MVVFKLEAVVSGEPKLNSRSGRDKDETDDWLEALEELSEGETEIEMLEEL